MKDLYYEFADLNYNDSFQNLGTTLGGVLKEDTLQFDNRMVKGEVLKKSFHEDLLICKWKLSVSERIKLRKLASPPGDKKKLTLLYVLTPSDVLVRDKNKKIRIKGSRNNLFWANETMMEFHLHPKQPFYLFDISFTISWLMEQLTDADPSYKKMLEQYIISNEQKSLIEPLTVDEFKTLHELEVAMLSEEVDDLFIRARAYAMLCNFFGKLHNKKEIKVTQTGVQFDQIIEAEMMILEDMKKPPSVEAIAKKVNMSVSSLVRSFKLIYGKSIHEYYLYKKMNLARKMIIESRLPVKEMAGLLGYHQPSAFIESFTKQHGYSPGALKGVSNQFYFF